MTDSLLEPPVAGEGTAVCLTEAPADVTQGPLHSFYCTYFHDAMGEELTVSLMETHHLFSDFHYRTRRRRRFNNHQEEEEEDEE